MDGVAENMPIIPIKQYHFEWIERAKQFYAVNDYSVKTTKCPGILSILNKGWIQRSYQDILIETKGDNRDFNWKTPIDQATTKNGCAIGDYIHWHYQEQFDAFHPVRPGTLQTILKINSPWFVEVPKGYSLLMMPVPYNDDNRFTAATGLLRGNNFLNVQLFWHCTNSVERIPAGTPLNHMILIKDDTVDYHIETIDNAMKYLKENCDQYK